LIDENVPIPTASSKQKVKNKTFLVFSN